jgi:hypothetical protein
MTLADIERPRRLRSESLGVPALSQRKVAYRRTMPAHLDEEVVTPSA